MEQYPTWIRVAGHATNIKSSHPHSWRCYIGTNSNEIALKAWAITNGVASQKNFIPGVNAAGDEHGLVAWIDCFGFYKIENEVLHIKLVKPVASPANHHAQQ